jgi:peptidoglycan hydrolase-like protein with peptidoglycan-binding domain
MDNSKKIGITWIIGGIVAGLVYFLRSKNSAVVVAPKAATVNTTTKSVSTAVSSTLSAESFPLKVGSKGTNTLTLQQRLNAALNVFTDLKPFYNSKGVASRSIAADGIFGNDTLAAVKWRFGSTATEITPAMLNEITVTTVPKMY